MKIEFSELALERYRLSRTNLYKVSTILIKVAFVATAKGSAKGSSADPGIAPVGEVDKKDGSADDEVVVDYNDWDL